MTKSIFPYFRFALNSLFGSPGFAMIVSFSRESKLRQLEKVRESTEPEEPHFALWTTTLRCKLRKSRMKGNAITIRNH